MLVEVDVTPRKVCKWDFSCSGCYTERLYENENRMIILSHAVL